MAYFAVDRDLNLYFLNVGQGDAIFIQAPNKVQVLIDGGPDGAVLRELTSIMPFYDRSIDMVILTHPDADHAGGLNDVIDRYSVGKILDPGVFASTTAYTNFKKHASTTIARRGMRYVLDQDVFLDILFPDRDTTGWETNTASIVAKLSYGSSTVLLTGDTPMKIEKFLTKYDDVNVDILKLAHHGSNTSSVEEFLAEATPEYAIVSAGKDNRYHHPHPLVIERVKKYAKYIVSTAEEGRIKFVIKRDQIIKK